MDEQEGTGSLIISDDDLPKIKYEPRQFIIDGLMLDRSITIVNGPRGCGKSWFAFAVANCARCIVEWIGPWQSNWSVNVMIVDGELPLDTLICRNDLMSYGVHCHKRLYFYSAAYCHRLSAPQISLLSPDCRALIKREALDRDVKLIVFDNLGALCPNIDENVKKEFDPVSQWWAELRYEGISVLAVHHTGKSGQQRGTSAHEDNADTVLNLYKPAHYHVSQGCRFFVKVDKDRNFIFDQDVFLLQLIRADPYGQGEAYLVFDEVGIEGIETALEDNPQMTETEAKRSGYSRATYFRAKKRLKTGVR